MSSASENNSSRVDGLKWWDADWAGLKVVVAGITKTGFSIADTMTELGARVVVVAASDDAEARQSAQTLKIVGVEDVLLGPGKDQSLPLLDGQLPDLVFGSPGMPPSHPLLQAAAEHGIPVWGDMELAWRLRARPGSKAGEWLAVTGTNGKTTTVGLAESMLVAAGLRAVAAGNVGTPILDVIRDPQGWDVIVVELSSFQLHWAQSLSPVASVCLNVAEDHVDWHGSYEAYVADKARVYMNTQVACVFNAEQEETIRMVEEADVVEGCRAIGFTTGLPAISMLGVVEDLLVDRAFIAQRKDSAAELASLSDVGDPVPRHLVANALAAAALVRAVGVEPVAVRKGIRNYQPGDHRIQLVARESGVAWINDSKATNPHAAAASLKSFQSVIWIAGGLSKGVTYDELVADIADRLKAVVLIGVDTLALETALKRHAPDVSVIRPDSGDTEMVPEEDLPNSTGTRVMERAVAAAADVAVSGDTVLMAPAAASMDQFTSYAHRGNAFADAVRSQLEGQAPTTKEL